MLRGLKEANEAGFRFEKDGSEGPFLGDVLHLDGKIKLVDTEPLGEYDEDEDRKFTAEPLVYSPLGNFIRSWWAGVAEIIGNRRGSEAEGRHGEEGPEGTDKAATMHDRVLLSGGD